MQGSVSWRESSDMTEVGNHQKQEKDMIWLHFFFFLITLAAVWEVDKSGARGEAGSTVRRHPCQSRGEVMRTWNQVNVWR